MNNGFPDAFAGYGNGLATNFKFVLFDTQNKCNWIVYLGKTGDFGLGMISYNTSALSKVPNLAGFATFL